MQGLSLDGALLPSLATARVPVATLSSPADYGFDSHNVWDVPGELLNDAIGSLGGVSADPDPILAQAGRTVKQADELRRQLGRFVGKDGQVHINPKAKYPETDFGRRLSGLAALLDANFPIRTAALTGPGSYDTHADQQGPLQDGATQIAEGLAAFQHDLERRGIGGRVLTLVWSEFGRRAQQNDSNGTDHGAAGVAFLMGTKVRQHMVGEFPGLTKGLDGDGNLRATSDFRSVYSSLVEQWFDVDAARIIPDAGEDAANEARRVRRLALIVVVLGASQASRRCPRGRRQPDGLSFVQVVEKEYTLTLSRPSVRSGQRQPRARQLRHGQPRPRDQERRSRGRSRSRSSSSPHAAAPSGRCASRPAATRSGARSRTTRHGHARDARRHASSGQGIAATGR